MATLVLVVLALLAILLPALKGYLIHAWIDRHVPQLGAVIPSDGGAVAGLVVGILLVSFWF